ncbi:hypothetical protein, partial [Mesonia mobilis]|uniref:hypothetical protein n=1 Tax=Mesonia mobilis TaxID=369791 RepID=UPI0026F057FD
MKNITGRFLGYSLSLTHLSPLARRTNNNAVAESSIFDSATTAAIAHAAVILIDSPNTQYHLVTNAVVRINPNALVFNVASGN